MQDGVFNVNAIVEKAAQGQQSPVQDPPAQDPPVKDPPVQDPPDPPAQDPPSPVQDAIEALLNETGFTSLEELKAAASRKVETPETPEEIKKKDEIYQANLAKYAVENNLMSLEDINKLQALKTSSDEDLVFKSFAEEAKDEILENLPDNATEEQILEAIKNEFEKQYPINAESERTRARAEAKLKKEAAELRKPLESSFNTVKSKFDDESSIRTAYPGYQSSMKTIVESAVPQKFSFFKGKDGDTEVVVDIDVAEDVKSKILETVRKEIVDRPETFLLHKNGKVDDVKAQISERVEFLMWKQLSETGKAKLAEVFEGIGRAKSEAGAKESFASRSESGKTGVDQLTAAQEVLKSTRNKK